MIRLFRRHPFLPLIILCCTVMPRVSTHQASEQQPSLAANQLQAPVFTIKNIIVAGNKYVPNQAIINAVPQELAIGKQYNPIYTSTLIRNVYNLGYFKQIHVLGEQLPEQGLNLYIVVEEKKRIENVIFRGNKNLSEETIRKKIPFDIIAADESEAKKYAQKIKKLYQDKDYHLVEITPEIAEHGDTADLIFNITENQRSFVKRVHFKGNHHISSRKLRKVLFTREDWLLSFMDKAGTYHPDALEMDRHQLETFYQNNGYLLAKVTDIAVDMDPDTKQYRITFSIDEGDLYHLSEITVEPHEHFTEKMLLDRLPIKKGDVYSREKLSRSIELLRLIWGEFGYIFADVIPSVQPDAKTKTVSISLKTELGEKVYLNRLTIKGNRKTRDKIIRRQILVEEGDIITTQKMDESKDKVELLGFFDKKDGVNWKTTRLSENLADLDLTVKEVKTGRVGFEMGVNPGGIRGLKSTNAGFTVMTYINERNLWGQGILFNLNGSFSKPEQTAALSLANPWLFDRPIYGGIDLYYSKSQFNEIQNVQSDIRERTIGGGVKLGFYAPTLFLGPSTLIFQAGGENRTLCQPQASANLIPDQRKEYQRILNRRFFSGNLGLFQFTISQDARNHPLHPTRGYQWGILAKVGCSDDVSFITASNQTNENFDVCSLIDPKNKNFGYYRFEFNGSWFTPLIDNDTLYLGIKGTLGLIRPLGSRNIPFNELYALGGPNSIRGFEPTEVSPRWRGSNQTGLGNTIGGTNAFSWTAELIFPVTEDMTTKVYAFYDGGSSWHTPDAHLISPERLLNNSFFYRHSVGIGLRTLKPTPIKIDWGFKLNPQKKLGEKLSELHFSAYQEF